MDQTSPNTVADPQELTRAWNNWQTFVKIGRMATAVIIAGVIVLALITV